MKSRSMKISKWIYFELWTNGHSCIWASSSLYVKTSFSMEQGKGKKKEDWDATHGSMISIKILRHEQETRALHRKIWIELCLSKNAITNVVRCAKSAMCVFSYQFLLLLVILLFFPHILNMIYFMIFNPLIEW